MEYRSPGVDFPLGSSHELFAYEDVESFGVNPGWYGVATKFNYSIRRFIRIKEKSETDNS